MFASSSLAERSAEAEGKAAAVTQAGDGAAGAVLGSVPASADVHDDSDVDGDDGGGVHDSAVAGDAAPSTPAIVKPRPLQLTDTDTEADAVEADSRGTGSSDAQSPLYQLPQHLLFTPHSAQHYQQQQHQHQQHQHHQHHQHQQQQAQRAFAFQQAQAAAAFASFGYHGHGHGGGYGSGSASPLHSLNSPYGGPSAFPHSSPPTLYTPSSYSRSSSDAAFEAAYLAQQSFLHSPAFGVPSPSHSASAAMLSSPAFSFSPIPPYGSSPLSMPLSPPAHASLLGLYAASPSPTHHAMSGGLPLSPSQSMPFLHGLQPHPQQQQPHASPHGPAVSGPHFTFPQPSSAFAFSSPPGRGQPQAPHAPGGDAAGYPGLLSSIFNLSLGPPAPAAAPSLHAFAVSGGGGAGHGGPAPAAADGGRPAVAFAALNGHSQTQQSPPPMRFMAGPNGVGASSRSSYASSTPPQHPSSYRGSPSYANHAPPPHGSYGGGRVATISDLNRRGPLHARHGGREADALRAERPGDVVRPLHSINGSEPLPGAGGAAPIRQRSPSPLAFVNGDPNASRGSAATATSAAAADAALLEPSTLRLAPAPSSSALPPSSTAASVSASASPSSASSPFSAAPSPPSAPFSVDALRGHVVRVCKTHTGSRFIQSKLEQLDPAYFDLLLAELSERIMEAACDNFGSAAASRTHARSTPLPLCPHRRPHSDSALIACAGVRVYAGTSPWRN